MDYDKIVKGGDYDDSENDQEIERTASEINENWDSFQSESIKDGDFSKVNAVDIHVFPHENQIRVDDFQNRKVTIGNNKQLKEQWSNCRPDVLINANPIEIFDVSIRTTNNISDYFISLMPDANDKQDCFFVIID